MSDLEEYDQQRITLAAKRERDVAHNENIRHELEEVRGLLNQIGRVTSETIPD